MKFKHLLPKREEGQGLVEYALLLVLVAIVVIAILGVMGQQVRSVFQNVVTALGGGGGYEYQITSFTVSGTGGGPGGSCAVTLGTLVVKVTDPETGEGVSGQGVAIGISFPGGPAGGTTVSSTTNSGGVANSWNTTVLGSASGGCGGTATASGYGESKQDTY